MEGLDFEYSKFSKGHNSVKKVGRSMALALCIYSNHALFFVQSFMKKSKRVSESLSGQDFQYSNF